MITVFSPAKINLFLAITGRRADGFHELVSVAAPVDFGDQLVAEIRGPSFARVYPRRSGGAPKLARRGGATRASDGRQKRENSGQFFLECNDPAAPEDESNLVLKAAKAFAGAAGWKGSVVFKLTKRIPLGAGLGGGSSNAVAALRTLNQLAGGLLDEARLGEMAAALGADCALFLKDAPVVMRGRGERVEALPESAAKRLRGRRVLLFKPGFSIRTAWAYQQMTKAARHYLPAAEAEARLAAWLRGDAPAEELLFNNMEGVAFEKFVALPVLLERLRREFNLAVRLSGSGSACFALLRAESDAAPVMARIRECWGPAAFVQEARLW